MSPHRDGASSCRARRAWWVLSSHLTDEEITKFVENPGLLRELEDKVKASGTKDPLELAAVQKLRVEVNSKKAQIDAAAREAEIEADKQSQIYY